MRKPVARPKIRSAPVSHRVLRQRGHVGARVAAVAGLGHEDAERVARIEIGFAAAQLVGRPLLPVHAHALARPPAQRVVFELGARAVGVQQPALFDELRHAGLGRELRMQRGRVHQQGAQRLGGALHTRLGPARGQVAHQPRQRARQMAPAHRERPQRIGQPARHLAPGAGERGRHHRMRGEPACVAVARRLRATGRLGLQKGHAQARAQCLDGGGATHRARADHHHVAPCIAPGGETTSCNCHGAHRRGHGGTVP
jgi:hypothetical protein